jgi:hypothetical protein
VPGKLHTRFERLKPSSFGQRSEKLRTKLVTRYRKAYQDLIVARMLPPESASMEQVSRETGLSLATLERWRVGNLPTMTRIHKRRTAAAQLLVTRSQLTASQSQLLRRITDDGLSVRVLQPNRGFGVCGQIRTLRILCMMGLVIEMRSEDEILFKLTEGGRELLRSELAAS